MSHKMMQLADFLALAERAEAAKRDYEVETQRIHAVYHPDSGMGLHLAPVNQTYRIGAVAHDQLATMAGIPRQYYQGLLASHPRHLAGLVEMHLHEDKQPEARFVRTIGGKVRALLSTRYGVLDHIDVARMAARIMPLGGGEVRQITISERRMSMQFVFPRLEQVVSRRVGDLVQTGVTLTNSEVGLGMFRLEELLFILACTNGMIRPSRGEWKLERVHRGTPDIRALADFSADRVRALPDAMGETIEMVRAADGIYLPEESLAARVESVRADHGLTQAEAEGTLESLYGEGRWTGWGLVNAINFQAHQAEADRSVELERISGQILEELF